MRENNRGPGLRTSLAVLGLAAALAPGVAKAQVAFYNGDWDGVSGMGSERNTQVSDGRTYDNFRLTEAVTIRGVWMNALVSDLSLQGAYYEIRRGVTPNNGGELVTSGTVDALAVPTGRNGFGLTEWHIRIPTGATMLPPDEYWVTVAVIGNGRGRAFVSTTDGGNRGPANEPNPPPLGFMRGRAYFDSPFFGLTFEPIVNVIGVDADFSFGVGTIDDAHGGYSLAEDFAVVRGDQRLGELKDLWFTDDRRLVIGQRYPFNVSSANAQVAVWTIAPNSGANTVQLKYEGRCTGTPTSRLIERVEFLNTRSNTWETLLEQPGSTSDRVTVVTSLVDSGRFVEPITNKITARIGWFDRGVLNLGWSGEIDELVWFSK